METYVEMGRTVAQNPQEIGAPRRTKGFQVVAEVLVHRRNVLGNPTKVFCKSPILPTRFAAENWRPEGVE